VKLIIGQSVKVIKKFAGDGALCWYPEMDATIGTTGQLIAIWHKDPEDVDLYAIAFKTNIFSYYAECLEPA